MMTADEKLMNLVKSLPFHNENKKMCLVTEIKYEVKTYSFNKLIT